ncbi:MAG: xanthine dehydrogenase family protein molybdopterin-binding subunit, partial [Anaerolineales bacterium]|nr:xanthine dehydrogenase family protein molybdopterin-binding subunit [Anaerolineales bacterium]
MATQYFGERIKRNEDPRLLTGRALFVDDVELPEMVHAAFVRSPYAHARIESVETDKALEREGVVAVYTAEDLGDYWRTGPLNVSPPPIERVEFHERTQPILAKDKVRHAGEAVAVVVAESRYVAEDAVNDVEVEYEALGAVVDLEEALESDAPLLHDDLDSNLAAHVIQEKG